jgi:hypothetical protein
MNNIISNNKTVSLCVSFFTLIPGVLFAQQSGSRDYNGHPEEGLNMALVGYHDLQVRPAYQPVIQKQGDRWVAYIGLMGGGQNMNDITGELEWNGTLVVDVTDPARPFTLSHIEGNEGLPSRAGSGAQMNRACTINGRTYLLRSYGATGHQVWDVTVPREPQIVITVVDDFNSVHKNWWECDTGIAYIVGGDETWRSRYTRIFDLSDPANPRFIRSYGVTGMEPGSDVEPVPIELHGPIVLGNTVYFGYGSSREGIIQIVDREKLLNGDPEPTAANFEAAEIGRLYLAPNYGAHTVLPVLGVPVPDYQDNMLGSTRDFLIMPSESTRNECTEERDAVLIVDITYPERPMPVSSYQVRESDGEFCQRGGRFGPHAVDESMYPPYYRKLVFVSYFNAGVRTVDIRDPFHPREVGYYIPATNEDTTPSCLNVGGEQRCKTAVQTNNVEVDDRGYIYIVDRVKTGMHILELTGEARQIVE